MWIDLNERKPDSGEQVKLKCKDGSEVWAFRGYAPCVNCWFSPFGGELLISPTHWHPIPNDEKLDTSIKINWKDLFQEEFKNWRNGK